VNRRLPAILAILALAGAATLALRSVTQKTAVATAPMQHRIDLVANVEGITTDAGWTMDTGRTRGAARFTLDDLRVLTVPDGTNAAEYDLMPACTDLVTPRACVLLADMLGEAVVWFALVPSDASAPTAELAMPGFTDMQQNGDEAVFPNGWVMKLATPTKRVCADTDTSSLRDFITRFNGDSARSIVDLTTDQIIRVECVK
jgi:hypothetical protein